MGLIFVPLTTITMSLIKRESMGNATSIFNLMRNLGGSVGIAAIGIAADHGRAKRLVVGTGNARGLTSPWVKIRHQAVGCPEINSDDSSHFRVEFPAFSCPLKTKTLKLDRSSYNSSFCTLVTRFRI